MVTGNLEQVLKTSGPDGRRCEYSNARLHYSTIPALHARALVTFAGAVRVGTKRIQYGTNKNKTGQTV
jgi:hypothetical protein